MPSAAAAANIRWPHAGGGVSPPSTTFPSTSSSFQMVFQLTLPALSICHSSQLTSLLRFPCCATSRGVGFFFSTPKGKPLPSRSPALSPPCGLTQKCQCAGPHSRLVLGTPQATALQNAEPRLTPPPPAHSLTWPLGSLTWKRRSPLSAWRWWPPAPLPLWRDPPSRGSCWPAAGSGSSACR